MEQHQIQVTLSVGTKLLVSVVSVLLIVITFLNVSSILLFREDKRAYTYQSQATTVVLAGREFTNLSKHALDTLRSTLANVDPRVELQPGQISLLKQLINSQTEILASQIYLTNLKTGRLEPRAEVVQEKLASDLEFHLSDYLIEPEAILNIIPELIESSFGFLNLTKLGGIPMVGIVFADVKLKDNSSGMPISIGFAPLKDFSGEMGRLKLTISSRSGAVLYDTDPTTNSSNVNILENPLFKAGIASKLASGAEEFDFEGKHYLGSYVNSGLNLLITTQTEWKQVMRATYLLIEKFILLGSMSVGAAVIFAILFSKTLTAPLQNLYEATKEVTKGNFLVQLEEKGRDEISALSGSFNIMSKKIADLIQESMAKVQLENEVAIASTVQQTLIPPAHFQNELLDIWSHYQSASSCGGDWWGFFGVGKKIAVMIADATGHGFPSALITASARSCFSVMHKLALEDEDFSFSANAMLNYVNRVVYDASLGKIMMTFFIGVLDFEENTLTYSSAGHNPPWLFQKDKSGFKLKSLTAVGPRVGETKEPIPFEEHSLPISAGDILFLYTDGLMEGKNKEDKMYGKKQARRMVEANLAEGPKVLVDRLIEDFLKYNEGKSLDDDVTVAAILILSGKTELDKNEKV